MRDDEVVAVGLHLDAQPTEGVGDGSEVAQRHVLDADAVAHHGGHTDERSHLNHVGQDTVVGAMQQVNTHDGDEVAANARNVGTHMVEHVAEFAGCKARRPHGRW